MDENPLFRVAADFVNNTARHVFLTGKAGTGKTTFLKYIREHTQKRCVVVAPTGVAAINAGGVTMHSFFQLPFGPFIPVSHKLSGDDTTDQYTLFKNIRVNENKRELFRDLELVIIDEVSMVRADMLDATDAILRYFRRRPHTPFGGVQVLYIGDLFQLPPVASDDDWSVLQNYYESPFFFHARVVQQMPPVCIELKKIYRQNDQLFIDVLNRVRNNAVTEDDLELLNERMHYEPQADKKYITLTTHNYRADRINSAALAELPGEEVSLPGTIEGDFPEKNLPTEPLLKLKEGAQVMFIRNDKSEDRRYFNGKLATVAAIGEDTIRVILDGSGDELEVERETWNNVRYDYDKDEEEIQEVHVGAFTQFPLRLAWAITIHKSQGLTFEHAVIDAGGSFAPGQVYVALSRCTSLNGLVLRSPITPSSISTDPRVLAFAEQTAADDSLETLLDAERRAYRHERFMGAFDLQTMVDSLSVYIAFLAGKKIPDPVGAIDNARRILRKATELQEVSQRFRTQLKPLLATDNRDAIAERVQKAIDYFVDAIHANILSVLDQHITSLKGAKQVKSYVRYVKQLRNSIARKMDDMQRVQYGDLVFKKRVVVPAMPAKESARSVKGSSRRETLALLREGLKPAEIASKRGLALSTIEGHLAELVKEKEADISECLEQRKLNEILAVIRELETDRVQAVREVVGEAFSYGEIRVAMNYYLAGETEASEK
jgi:hypothetical protein